jgi:hypothetical protein
MSIQVEVLNYLLILIYVYTATVDSVLHCTMWKKKDLEICKKIEIPIVEDKVLEDKETKVYDDLC